jgi:hypothetical protein
MKRLLLLFPLCLLLANTELRAQKNDTQELLQLLLLLQLLKSSCPEDCYTKYQNFMEEEAKKCIRYYDRDYCKMESIRARAREEYEMCLLKCKYKY